MSDKCFSSGKWLNEDNAIKENQKLLRWIRDGKIPQETSTNDSSQNSGDPLQLSGENTEEQPSGDENIEEEKTEMQRARENMLAMHE